MEDQATAKNIPAEEVLQLASDIVAAYVGNNVVPASEVPNMIRDVHNALRDINGAAVVEDTTPQKPAVPVKKSVTPDYIICLEDGKQLKMLKRYLRTNYDMSPEEYRAKWKLPSDYPMVAPNYAAKRSEFAKKIGLGKKAEKTPVRRAKRKAA